MRQPVVGSCMPLLTMIANARGWLQLQCSHSEVWLESALPSAIRRRVSVSWASPADGGSGFPWCELPPAPRLEMTPTAAMPAAMRLSPVIAHAAPLTFTLFQVHRPQSYPLLLSAAS